LKEIGKLLEGFVGAEYDGPFLRSYFRYSDIFHDILDACQLF